MRRALVVCVVAGTWAMSGLAQEAEWQRLAQQGVEAERTGNFQAARDAFLQAARAAEAGPPTLDLGSIYNALAIVCKDLGQFPQAIHQYRRSLAVIEKVQGKNNEEYAVVLANLGTDLAEEGRQVKAAEGMIREAIGIYKSLPAVPEQRLASARNSLGELLLHSSRLSEAEVLLKQAMEAFAKDPNESGKLGAAVNNLAGVRRAQGREQEAIDLLLRGVRLMEDETGPDHPRLIRPLNNLGTTYDLMGKPETAAPFFERALAIAEKRLGTEHPLYAQVLLNYSDCIKAQGDKRRAKTLAAEARRVLDDHNLASGRGMTVDVSSFR